MKILIIKTGAIGDVLRTSFIAQALKDKYAAKDPSIYWITSNSAKLLFVNSPYVDCLLTEESREKLANEKFDIAINLEEDEKNCKFVSALNAGKKMGFLYQNGQIISSSSAKEWFDMSAVGKKPMNDVLKKRNKKT